MNVTRRCGAAGHPQARAEGAAHLAVAQVASGDVAGPVEPVVQRAAVDGQPPGLWRSSRSRTVTGTAAGRRAGAVAGALLERAVLELGGNNPILVLDDADLDGSTGSACPAP